VIGFNPALVAHLFGWLRRHLALAAALVLCFMGPISPQAVAAQEMEVPVMLQAELFLKVMTFDRNLASRTKDETVVIVVYQSGNKLSNRTQEEFVRTVERLRRTWKGSVLHIVTVDLDQEDLEEALRGLNAAALYVAPLRGVDIENIASVARTGHIATFSGVPRYITRGLAVGVRVKGDRPKLMVNLQASRLEGTDFSAELLTIAEVIQ
jgi:hypothetical protein